MAGGGVCGCSEPDVHRSFVFLTTPPWVATLGWSPVVDMGPGSAAPYRELRVRQQLGVGAKRHLPEMRTCHLPAEWGLHTASHRSIQGCGQEEGGYH